MKKKVIIISICLIVILVLAISAYFIFSSKDREYNVEQVSGYKYFILNQDEKYGVIDAQGNVLVQPNYDLVKIPNPTKGVFVCYEGNSTKVLNENSEEINTEYQNVEPLTLKNVSTDLIYEKSILSYEENGKYGIISLEGNRITKPIYDSIETLQYKEGELLIQKDGKYGVMNMNGYVIIEPEYDLISADGYYSEQEGYRKDGYIVSVTTDEGYRYGYIDNNGQKLVETQYNDLERMDYEDSDNIYIIAAQDGKYGLINADKTVIPNEYQEITYIDEKDVCILKKGRKYGVADLTGNIILPVEYSQIDVSGDNIYATDENNSRTVYDIKGNKLDIDANTVILTVGNDREYQINMQAVDAKTTYDLYKNNQKINQESYNYIGYLFDNYFIVSKEDGKLGVIDDTGSIRVDMVYDSIQKLQDKKIVQATQSASQKVVLYDESMTSLLEMESGTITEEDDYVRVQNANDIKYVNKDGKVVQSSEVFPNNNLLAKSQDGKWGFVNKEGNVVVDYQYDKVTELNQYGFAGVMKDGKWGVVDRNGDVIVEPVYELTDDNPEFIGLYYRVLYGFGEFYYTK